MKRILLFVATHLAVLLVLSVITSVLGVDRFLVGSGIDVAMPLVIAAVIGFGDAIVSEPCSRAQRQNIRQWA